MKSDEQKNYAHFAEAVYMKNDLACLQNLHFQTSQINAYRNNTPCICKVVMPDKNQHSETP